jgi:hypothetical protein
LLNPDTADSDLGALGTSRGLADAVAPEEKPEIFLALTVKM